MLITMSKVFNYLFKYVNNNNLFKTDLNNQIILYKHNFNSNKNLYLLNFIIKDIFSLLNPAFNYKLVTQNKKKT